MWVVRGAGNSSTTSQPISCISELSRSLEGLTDSSQGLGSSLLSLLLGPDREMPES